MSVTAQRPKYGSGASNAGRFSILQEPDTGTLLCFFIFLQGQEMQAPATSTCYVECAQHLPVFTRTSLLQLHVYGTNHLIKCKMSSHLSSSQQGAVTVIICTLSCFACIVMTSLMVFII